MEKEKKKGMWKARLIALGISLLMLAAGLGVTLWQYFKLKADQYPFDLTTMLIINGVGFVIMYLIFSHFLKKNMRGEDGER